MNGENSILIICSSCRRIKTEDGKWELRESDLSDSNVMYSHSICEACSKRLYPEYCES